MEKTLAVNDIVEAKVIKVKNDKPTIISYNGDRYIKESPFQGTKAKKKGDK